MGDLRDTQLLRARVKRLDVAGDPVRKRLLRLFSRQEQAHRESAEKALDDFDRKEWKKLDAETDLQVAFFPGEQRRLSAAGDYPAQ